jgi:hypothetical protein
MWKWPSTASEAGYGIVSSYVSIWPSYQIADRVMAWARLDMQRHTCTEVNPFALSFLMLCR